MSTRRPYRLSAWRDGLHPIVIAAAERIVADMAAAQRPVKVTSGLRTTAQQQALYAQGRTTPGRIVTYCDGIVRRSNHQADADGVGRAVDFAFVGTDPYGESQPWALLGETIERHGLAWGGRWLGKKRDRPHAELR